MTSRCSKAVALLGPAHDGELAAPDNAWLQEHLAGCAPCRRRQVLQKTVGLALRQKLTARADQVDLSFFATRVLARIAEDQRTRAPWGERASVWLREMFSAHGRALGAGAALASLGGLLVVAAQVAPRVDRQDQSLALASARLAMHAQADIEQLEVYGQEGVVLQIPGQSTMIWVTDDPNGGAQ